MNESNKYYQNYKKVDPIMDAYYEKQKQKVVESQIVKEKTKADEIREYLKQQESKSKKKPK